jgi:hypothetical protein
MALLGLATQILLVPDDISTSPLLQPLEFSHLFCQLFHLHLQDIDNVIIGHVSTT